MDVNWSDQPNVPSNDINTIIGYIEDIVISDSFQVSILTFQTSTELSSNRPAGCYPTGNSNWISRQTLHGIYERRRKQNHLHGYLQWIHETIRGIHYDQFEAKAAEYWHQPIFVRAQVSIKTCFFQTFKSGDIIRSFLLDQHRRNLMAKFMNSYFRWPTFKRSNNLSWTSKSPNWIQTVFRRLRNASK